MRKLKLNRGGMGPHMVMLAIPMLMVAMRTHIPMDITILERDLPMPKPKLNHGMDMAIVDTTDTHTDTVIVVMATHMPIGKGAISVFSQFGY